MFPAFASHQDWTEYFLADPTTLGVTDSYGIELVHPCVSIAAMGSLARKASRIIAAMLTPKL